MNFMVLRRDQKRILTWILVIFSIIYMCMLIREAMRSSGDKENLLTIDSLRKVATNKKKIAYAITVSLLLKMNKFYN
jgi:hypothetical protein